MGRYAKAVGVYCLISAVAVGALAVGAVLLMERTYSGTPTERTEEYVPVIEGLGLLALLLAGVGAVACLVGKLARDTVRNRG